MAVAVDVAPRPARTGGSPPRVAHAFPDGSDVALCGALKSGEGQPLRARRCARCLREARRKHFLGR